MGIEREARLLAVDIVKREERLRLTRYLCQAGLPTIGYGHRCAPDQGPIAEAQADVFLLEDMDIADGALFGLALSVGQRAALLSFVFNVGVSAFRSSTLRKKIAGGDYAGAAREFGRWVRVRKGSEMVVSPGLVARRNRERLIFEGVEYVEMVESAGG